MRIFVPLALLMPSTLIVTACGNSESPKSVPTPPVLPVAAPSPPEVISKPATVPSTTDFNTPEYRASNAAVASNAIGAWQNGATGQGITIGFVDTGVVSSRSDFIGKIHHDSRDVAGSRLMDDTFGHGTGVAGIAAAARDQNGMHGVAFDATIFMAKADQGCPASCSFTPDAVARGIDAARLAGARVINLSIGGNPATQIDDAVLRAVKAGIVLVVGSGNSGPAPSAFAQGLAKIAPGNVIIVGALGSALSDTSPIGYEVLSTYSTPAGSSKLTYLAAPGLYNAATYFRSDGIDRLSGSSFAAPVVSGALALLAQAFPSLRSEQLIKLLYTTADDLGASGVDDVFGQGRLNIGRAFQPVGSLRMAGTALPIIFAETTTAPAASGDAVYQNEIRATVLDSFDRAFSYNLASDYHAIRSPGPLASIRLIEHRESVIAIDALKLAFTVSGGSQANVNNVNSYLPLKDQELARLLATAAIARFSDRTSLAFGFKTDSVSLRNQMRATSSSMSLTITPDRQHGFVGNNARTLAVAHRWKSVSVYALGEQGSIQRVPKTGEPSAYTNFSAAAFYTSRAGQASAAINQIRETSSLLGSNLIQAFGANRSTSRYVDVGITRFLSRRFNLSANLRVGRTHTTAGDLKTRAFSVEFSGSRLLNNHDNIMVSVSQPLRVEAGLLSTYLPVSWDYSAQQAEINRVDFNLAPSGRELKTEIAYGQYFDSGNIIINAYVRRQPHHIATQSADVGVSLRSRLSF